MNFLLEINYANQLDSIIEHENLFLGMGWGRARDVRGPYMTRSLAVIEISRWALSQRVNSYLHLQFGLSNRAPVDGMIFKLIGSFGASSHLVQRNSDVDVSLENIRVNHGAEIYPIKVILHEPQPSKIFEFMDILAINRLSICR